MSACEFPFPDVVCCSVYGVCVVARVQRLRQAQQEAEKAAMELKKQLDDEFKRELAQVTHTT